MLVRLDHGRGRDWDLEQVDRWAAWATAAFPFKESDGERETDVSGLSQRIHYLRHALLTAMKHELELVTAEEYGRALLFQLARYLKFTRVPIPKKVLGVRMFVRLLRSLKLIER